MTDRTGADEERTFAASTPAHGRGFAGTWWGLAWLRALEDAALDGAQVKVGRRLARAGAVGAVSVRPGRVTAVVQDRDGTAHRADVLLQELPSDRWDRFLDMAAERAGHVAALLDREMPPHLVEDAAAHGVELLPGLGDLEARCDCGAWDHCGHTAALCYQVARLLDEDPFVLLLMRGRAERALLDELQDRSVAPVAEAEATPEGVQDGRQEAWTPWRRSRRATSFRRSPSRPGRHRSPVCRPPWTPRPRPRPGWTRPHSSSWRHRRPGRPIGCWPRHSARGTRGSRWTTS